MTEAYVFVIGILLAWLAGIRVYLTLFGVGLAGLLGWVDLPPALQATQSWWVLGTSGALALTEFFADKIPGVDSIWDLLQTLARVPAGAFLAAATLSPDGQLSTGVLAAVLARRGIERVVATDQDARALTCARENVERLGLAGQVEVLQAEAPKLVAQTDPEPVAPPAIAAVTPTPAPAPRASEPAMPDKGGGPRVLFAGDSMMKGVAPFAIAQIRKIHPEGFYSDQSKLSTGLTARRYFDWPARIREEVGKHRFDTLVVFLGPNDPWDIVEDGKRHLFPSDNWVEKYRARVAEIMAFCKQNRVQVIWIGLPNMRNERTRQGAVVENRIFSEEARRFGFTYLSTEELFGSLDEPFRKHIDDPQKGQLAVRTNDGTHFTPTGLRMISARLVEAITTGRTQ